jgi:hypothetical protein
MCACMLTDCAYQCLLLLLLLLLCLHAVAAV